MPLTRLNQGVLAVGLAIALLGPLVAWGDEADDSYAAAAKRYVAKEWAGAAGQFQAFLDKHPDHPKSANSLFYLAEALLQSGQRSAATSRFREYLGKSPDGQYAKTAMFRAGEASYLNRQFAPAKSDLGMFLIRYPEDPLMEHVLSYLGNIALVENDAATAERLFRRSIRDFPNGPRQDDCRFGLAQALEKQGKSEEATALYRALVEQPVTALSDDAQFHLAALQYAQGRFADAASSFERMESVFADSPWLPTARLAHGWALFKLGRFDEACKRFESIQSDPRAGTDARYWLGLTYKAQKDWPSAARVFRDAADRDESHPLAAAMRFQMADTLSKAGQLDEAAAALEQVLNAAPEPGLAAEATLARGNLLERLGRSEEALTLYGRVANQYGRTPQCTDALLAAARLNERLASAKPSQRRQHLENACALYQRLVEERPQPPDADAALYGAAWAMIELDRIDEADRLFRRLRSQFPRSRYFGHATLPVAQRAFDASDYRQAEELLTGLLDQTPDPAIVDRVLYLRAHVALADEKWAVARGDFERLLSECPASSLRLAAEYGAAEAAFRQTDYATAGEQFRRLALETQSGERPLSAVILLRVAQLQSHDRQWDEALQTALRIKKEFPDFPDQHEVDYVIGLCKSNQADFDGARAAYEAVLGSGTADQTETGAKAQFMIAESYLQQQRFEKALEEYLRLESKCLYPELQAAGLLQAAKCSESIGRWTEAVDLYTKLLKTYPTTSPAAEAGQRLGLARKQAARDDG